MMQMGKCCRNKEITEKITSAALKAVDAWVSQLVDVSEIDLGYPPPPPEDQFIKCRPTWPDGYRRKTL